MDTPVSSRTRRNGGPLAHFDVLDGLRGVAALLVLLGHETAIVFGTSGSLAPRKELAAAFFFMLSGFVISSAYEDHLRRGMPATDFLARRVIRLYPLIALGIAVGSLAWIVEGADFGLRGYFSIGLGLLALPSPQTGFSFGNFPINPPEWSLCFEMLAYILFYLFRPSNLYLCIFIAMNLLCYMLVDWAWYGPEIPTAYFVFQAVSCFYIGLLLWRAHDAGYLSRVVVSFWALAALIVGGCLIPLWVGPVVNWGAVLLLFPSVIIVGSNHGRRASSRTFRLLGRLSYPTYILHWTILVVTSRFLITRLNVAATVVLSLVVALLFSWVALEVFDEPVRNWLSRRYVGGARSRNISRRAAQSEGTS